MNLKQSQQQQKDSNKIKRFCKLNILFLINAKRNFSHSIPSSFACLHFEVER